MERSIFFEIRVPSGFMRFGLLSLSFCFQNINIGWPQQPPTEKVLKFNIIFHDSNKKYVLAKYQNKAEFKGL